MSNRRVRLAPTLLLCLVPTSAAAGDKPQVWTEVRSPHFVVMTNTNAKQGRRVAEQFEQVRGVFQLLFQHARVDPGVPFRILAVKDEKSLHGLLPGYWEKKGQFHPAGMFVAGIGKYYVALRLDTEGERPYQVLYHEYIHLLVSLSFEHIPLWVNEGLAEFWGNTDIGEKEVTLGNYSLTHLEQLRGSKLLPLDMLLTADEHSPYYNEENKASVFYAESWALVHYLLLGENRARAHELGQYLKLVVENKLGPIEAARQAFGDLDQLSKSLSSYANQNAFSYLRIKPPAQLEDKDFPIRELPAAESLALLGDFYAQTNRPVEARNMLEQAQAIDPKLAAVFETYGLLALRENNPQKAAERFERAVELDSRSYLAQYYAAFVAIEHGADGALLDQAEARLKRAIELNPEFAQSYSALAHVYVVRGDKLGEALDFALKAAKLEPADFSDKVNIGYILLRMKRVADAQTLAAQIMPLARTDQEREMAQLFLNQVEAFTHYQESGAPRQQTPSQSQGAAAAQNDSDGEKITLRRRQAPSTEPPAGPRLNAAGRIASVSCDGFALDLMLASRERTLSLHTDNYYKLEFEAVNWEPPPNFNPCKELEGRDARVVYVASTAAKDAGVLLTVEVRGSEKK